MYVFSLYSIVAVAVARWGRGSGSLDNGKQEERQSNKVYASNSLVYCTLYLSPLLALPTVYKICYRQGTHIVTLLLDSPPPSSPIYISTLYPPTHTTN